MLDPHSKINRKKYPHHSIQEPIYRQGFSLWEMMLVVGILGLLSGIAFLNMNNYLEKWRLFQATSQIKLALDHAQWMALTHGNSYRIRIEQGRVFIESKPYSQNQTFWDKVPDSLNYQATRWPSFSPFGFASSGTIQIKGQQEEKKLIVSVLGRVREE